MQATTTTTAATYEVFAYATAAGFATVIYRDGELFAAGGEMPTVDAAVVDALREVGDLDPEADAEVVNVENGSIRS